MSRRIICLLTALAAIVLLLIGCGGEDTRYIFCAGETPGLYSVSGSRAKLVYEGNALAYAEGEDGLYVLDLTEHTLLRFDAGESRIVAEEIAPVGSTFSAGHMHTLWLHEGAAYFVETTNGVSTLLKTSLADGLTSSTDFHPADAVDIGFADGVFHAGSSADGSVLVQSYDANTGVITEWRPERLSTGEGGYVYVHLWDGDTKTLLSLDAEEFLLLDAAERGVSSMPGFDGDIIRIADGVVYMWKSGVISARSLTADDTVSYPGPLLGQVYDLQPTDDGFMLSMAPGGAGCIYICENGKLTTINTVS